MVRETIIVVTATSINLENHWKKAHKETIKIFIRPKLEEKVCHFEEKF